MKMVELGEITLKGGKREDRCVLSAGLNEFDEFSTKKHRITDAWHREFVSSPLLCSLFLKVSVDQVSQNLYIPINN